MRLLILFLVTLMLPTHAVPDGWEAQGPNTRVMRHQDGSRTVYRRKTGQKTLVKKNIDSSGKVRLITHYYMDKLGNPRSCKIYDSGDNLMFKVSYAYEINSGRLMAERMFFADKKDPKTGTPLLASETRYSYDAHGNRSRPITFTFVKGQRAEEVFGDRKSTFPEQAFEDQHQLANPNAKRLGKKK